LPATRRMNRDFVDLLRALRDADARHLIVGAYALAHHGRPRARLIRSNSALTSRAASIALHGVDDDATLITDDHYGIGIAETDCHKDAIRHSDYFARELIRMRDSPP
jgi:hypothetical protein